MNLKPLDPQITLKLLEGRKNVITPLAEEREIFYRSQHCPRCGGNAHTKTGNPHKLFVDNEPLPRYQLICDNCSCLFDPFTGLILEMGNLANAYKPTIPLIDKD